MAIKPRRDKFVVTFIIAHVVVAVAAAFIAGHLLSTSALANRDYQRSIAALWYSLLLAQSILFVDWATRSNGHRFLRWVRTVCSLVAIFYIAVMFSTLGGFDSRYAQRRQEWMIFIAMLLCIECTLTLLIGVFQEHILRVRPYPRRKQLEQFQLWHIFMLITACAVLFVAWSESIEAEGQFIRTHRLVRNLFGASCLAAIAQVVFCLTLATAVGRTRWIRATAGGMLMTIICLGIAEPELLRWGRPWVRAPYAALFFGGQLLSYVPLAIWRARQPRTGNDFTEPASQTEPGLLSDSAVNSQEV